MEQNHESNMYTEEHVGQPFYEEYVRVRLDVDIGGAGIEFGSIPKQPWY